MQEPANPLTSESREAPTPMAARASASLRPGTFTRAFWLGGGLAGCGLGFVGILVPGMPATVFFILAAFCFSKSSDRLLNWVLSLPKVGPMVRDYRAGLGMPRAAKASALVLMLGCGGGSLAILPRGWPQWAVVVLLLVGVWVVWRAVPTRERVLARAAVRR